MRIQPRCTVGRRGLNSIFPLCPLIDPKVPPSVAASLVPPKNGPQTRNYPLPICRMNHCLAFTNRIQLRSRSSTFVPPEVKSVPPLHLHPRSVLLVWYAARNPLAKHPFCSLCPNSHPKRSEKISPKLPPPGKVYE